MEKLIKHSPKIDGITISECVTYTIESPTRENSDLLREIAQKKGYIYAMCGGTPRLVPPEMEGLCKKYYTSYYKIDEENKPLRRGGINYQNLIEKMMRGDIKAMSFSYFLDKTRKEILVEKVDKYTFIDNQNPDSPDNWECAAALMYDWGGQDALFKAISIALKRKDKTWGTEWADEAESYYDFLVDNLSPFITDLFFPVTQK